jgi:hypothetical protein
MGNLFIKPKIFTSNQVNTGVPGTTITNDYTMYQGLGVGPNTIIHGRGVRTVGVDVWSADTTNLILLANDLKAKYNAHRVDLAQHPFADGVNIVTAADASDFDSCYSLVGDLMIQYTAHNADAELAAAWAYHLGQNSSTHVLSFGVIPYTNAGVVAAINEIKTKYNAHDDDNASHMFDSLHQTAVASTLEQWAYNTTYIIREDATDILNNIIVDSLGIDYNKFTFYF